MLGALRCGLAEVLDLVPNGRSVASAGGSACVEGTGGARAMPACAVIAVGRGVVRCCTRGACSVALRRGGGSAQVGIGRRDSAVRSHVARAVPAVAWCLRIGDAVLSSRAGARRSRWRSVGQGRGTAEALEGEAEVAQAVAVGWLGTGMIGEAGGAAAFGSSLPIPVW